MTLTVILNAKLIISILIWFFVRLIFINIVILTRTYSFDLNF